MSTTVEIKIEKGSMPRHGLLNQPLQINLDDQIIKDADWGDHRTYGITPGKHVLTVILKNKGISAPMAFSASEGDSVKLFCYIDRTKGGLTVIDLADSNSAEIIADLGKKASHDNERIISVCAFVGALAFVVLNILTNGAVPGGFIGGAIGGGVGALVGWVITALIRKK
jgi:hypothetical protein